MRLQRDLAEGGGVTREDKLERALGVGVAMRRVQTIYFKTRTQEALVQSKSLEREFDRLAADALGLVPEGEPRLL
jgi:hypothetical protein